MKTLVLLFTGMLFSLNTVTALGINTDTKGIILEKTKRFRLTQPISFVERGVEFLIFPDGSFDFNTELNNIQTENNFYYKSNSKRSSINTTYGTPNRTIKYTSQNRGVIITHDRDGKVRRVGNVFINYDRAGKITRAGSVYMSYNRGNGFLNQVGGLKINYNHWGEIVKMKGDVNNSNRFNDYYINNSSWVNNNEQYDNNNGFYYYKQNGKVKTKERRK